MASWSAHAVTAGHQGQSKRKRRRAGKPCGAWCFLKAGDRNRTGDPQLGKLMLYQLSYARVTY